MNLLVPLVLEQQPLVANVHDVMMGIDWEAAIAAVNVAMLSPDNTSESLRGTQMPNLNNAQSVAYASAKTGVGRVAIRSSANANFTIVREDGYVYNDIAPAKIVKVSGGNFTVTASFPNVLEQIMAKIAGLRAFGFISERTGVFRVATPRKTAGTWTYGGDDEAYTLEELVQYQNLTADKVLLPSEF